MSDDEQQAPPTQEEVKSEDALSTINIKVVSSTGEEVFFKIKRSTKLSKLQGAYASKVGKDVSSIRFLYDGSRIADDDTPQSLDMEDNDTIDVMVERRRCIVPSPVIPASPTRFVSLPYSIMYNPPSLPGHLDSNQTYSFSA
ncbi:ubiquitin-related domain-containing protein [Mycena maculata]|uniref:Ubiquitin-related domain-containing protein n=1 Tax=Mycena maculata TaxID=230809 RepID=A0AAD7ISH9_9AGAR|nr:ubiquitin-related domain-containing protein [Mycena maculata]